MNSVIIVILIVLIPLLTMLFTNEVDWTFIDFAIAGILLFSLIQTVMYIQKNIKNLTYKNIILSIIIVMFLIVWAELAVGLFGTFLAGN